jgi:predicted transcriptional regulator
MTQADFADRCGVTQAHMSTIINLGRDVRLSTYEKIDAALKVLEGTQGAGRS